MNTEQRIKMIRLIEKIDKNPEFSQKIGIRNTSAFVSDKSKKITTDSHVEEDGRRRRRMLTLLFTICMIWFIGKFFIFGLKASWGILKLLCTVVFFPVILIGMVVGGLVYIAFPLLLIGGIIGLIVSKS